jgi:hypothetical protein
MMVERRLPRRAVAATNRLGAGRWRFPGVPGPAALALLAVLALAPLLAGCGMSVHNLNLRVDDRLHFLSPPSRALVANPVTVHWRMSASSPGKSPGGGDYFAIFVDQAPIRPGQTMRAVASRDEQCLHQAACPNRDYLAQRQIYLTSSDQVTLGQIPSLAGDKDAVQLHSVVVVLMGPTGHRMGESAWELDLRMRRIGF